MKLPIEVDHEQDMPEDTAPLSTWKRIPRVDKPVVGRQAAVVGQKRTSTSYTSHSDLPNKKFVVFQNDADKTQILAEAGFQPCQK